MTKQLQVLFSGCSWGCVFYIGCIRALYEITDYNHCKIISTSSGCIAAISFLLNKDISFITKLYRKMSLKCRKHITPLGKMSGWLKEILTKLIDDDKAAIFLSNRLTVVYTDFPRMKSIYITKFNNKEHLIRICLASCFIPLYFTELIVLNKFSIGIDAGFTNKYPTLSKFTIRFGVDNSLKYNTKLDVQNSIKISKFIPSNNYEQQKAINNEYYITSKFLN